jgi:oligoendopeptidase F
LQSLAWKEKQMTPTHERLRWSLQDLFPGGVDDLEKVIAEIESCTREIEASRPQLSTELPVSEFLSLLRSKEHLKELAAQVGAYAYLNYAQNTQNPEALSLRDRVNLVLTEADNRTLFFSLWFRDLSTEAAGRYIAAAGELSYYLEAQRRFRPYTLSEAEEKVINLKDLNGIEGLVKVYEILTNSFKFRLEVDGELKTLTRDGLNQYYRHPSPQVRAATFQELYRVYGKNKNVLAQIYTSLVRDMRTEMVGLRGYASPISVRNLGNDLPDEVVDTLLAVCRQNTGLYQRYFRLKARLLGMPRLRRYDIYAPVAQADKAIDFEAAIQVVLSSFQQFSPQVAQAAARVFEQNHLDAEVRPGKRGGAFCYTVTPHYTPWVMVNFTGRIRDVSTLAHELGHAVHAMLAAGHSVLNYHAPLPLAETASVFAEMLLSDRLLREETDPAVQRDILMSILDDAYATVQRQAFISIFEQAAHDRIEAGCTSEDLARLYLENLSEQFGEAVELSDEFAWEWITIPHIFQSPFYPYAYSFGQLLVLALYQQYLDEGKPFLPRYLKILAYGGSAEPKTVLAEAGLDIASPEFWQGGFNVLQTYLERLEGILGGAQ